MAQEIIYCTQDTYASFGGTAEVGHNMSGFYGNEPSMRVMMSLEDIRKLAIRANTGVAIMQFNIPQFENKRIEKAELKVCCEQRYKGVTVSAFRFNIPIEANSINGSMFRRELAFNDMGKSPTEHLTDYPNNGLGGWFQWYAWDVTSIVQNSKGEARVSLVLVDTDNTNKNYTTYPWWFKSKESGYTPYVEVTYNDAVPDLPTILYPNGDVIEKGNALIFQWKHNSLYDTGQTKYDFGWRQQGNASWTDVLGVVTTAQSRTLDTSSMPTGIIEWRVRTYNANNAVSEYAYGAFELTGRPTAPIIDSMKNDATTEITWRSNEAETAIFRLWIYQGATLVHDSGERPGGFTSSYIPNMMFPDGAYTVKMRIGSVYGVWSDEAAKVFTISTPQMAKPGFSLSAAKAGIRITAETINNYLRYVRYSPNADGSNMTESRQPNSQYVGVGYMPKEVYEHENLYTGTKDFSGTWANITGWTDSGYYEGLSVKSRNAAWSGLAQLKSSNVGEIYTYSAYLKVSAIGITSRSSSVGTPAGSASVTIIGNSIMPTLTDTWQRCNFSFKVVSAGTIRPGFERNATNGTLQICGCKLEIGEAATPWTPAPSDWLKDPNNYTWIPIQSYDNVNAAERIVYRSENGIDFSPIARFTGESYIDYAVKSGTVYEYFLRAHKLGYSDSDKLTMKVDYKGVIISNVNTPDDYIQAYQSDSDWYNVFKTTPKNEAELISYEGREYPVKEAGIHRSYEISTSFFLDNSNAKRLREMHQKNGIYLFRSAEECFCCEIEINDENTLFNRGKKVEVTLTRLDYDMGVRFDV